MSDFAEEFRESWSQRLRGLAIPGAILLLVAGTILYFLHDTAGIRREAPPLPTLIATLPPPPPPPPPPKQQPEPEKKIEEQKPVEQPKMVNSAPKAITEAGPAQAGTDAFGIQAGSGGGEVGSGGGFGDANYTRYLGSTLQQTIQNDDRVNHLVFTADMAVWVDADGRITHATVLKSSGDPGIDQDLVAALQGMPALDEPPPSDLQFPQRIRIEGRHASG
ncbi:MAG TPA: energy transducer TonB [Rhizomicrobium sp.]|jgi:TonB family protein|nr:energy transducer TonB [Rhizomicrobium sp.]